MKNLKTISQKEYIKIDSKIYDVYPDYFDTRNPNFLVINDKYVSNLIVISYNKEMEAAFLDKIISMEIDLQLSIFYEKQNTTEIIKKITYNIGNVGSEVKETSENQVDMDIMTTTYNDAKYLRRQLQISGEDFYYIYIYISICSNTVEKLEQDIQKVEGIASGIGLNTRRGIFRQKQIFEVNMPCLKNDNNIKKLARRNVLTSGIVATYPFLSNELCDEFGVLLGINKENKSIVMINRFDSNKYKNANMCVIGTSGSGKSYFTKLMVARNRYMGISQYVIDPEREYAKLCKKLDGTVINFENGNVINVMDIRWESIEDGASYLQNKINKLNTFFSLIFPDISLEEKSLLEEKIIECYEKKGINFNDESLYKINNKNRMISKKCFKESADMPILKDLYNILKKEKKLSKISTLIKPYVTGSMKFLNGHTNVDLSNQLVVADIYNIEEANLPVVMYVITELFWDKIRSSRKQKKIIYLDEVWRLIDSNEETANFVFKMFKTIRKYGGAATAITQDINDFFVLEDGKYGRGILNNSSIKTIFQLEENDIKILQKNIKLSEEEIYKIQNAKRGTCLLYAGTNHVVVSIEASKKENEFISTDIKDN